MRSRPWVEVLNGFCMVFSLHLGFMALALLMLSLVGSSGIPGAIFHWFLTLLGLSQLLYVGPIAVLYWRRRALATVKGMAIAAVLTMLLNGSCYVNTPPEFYGIQIFAGVCISVVSLFVLAKLADRRR